MPKSFADVRVLVLGAHTGALQFYLRRFPAPGDYLVAHRYREAADGGKGSNQAIAAARLGARVTLISAVGDDTPGRAALDYMRREGIDVGPVLISRDHPTGLGAGFYLEDGSVMGATHLGATVDLTAEYLDAHREVFAAGYDVFLASLEVPADVVLHGLALARESGIPLRVLNPSPADDLPGRALSDVDVLTPNEPEGRLLAGLAPDGDDPSREVARRVAARHEVPLVLMTLGSAGCYALGRGLDEPVPCPRVQAVDTSGAGDCLNASISIGLAAGRPLRDAVGFALRAASISVTRPDSWPAFPTAAEVTAFGA